MMPMVTVGYVLNKLIGPLNSLRKLNINVKYTKLIHCRSYHLLKPTYCKLLKLRNDLLCTKQRLHVNMISSAISNCSNIDEKIRSDYHPFEIVNPYLKDLFQGICKELKNEEGTLEQISTYFFDGKGKAIRPTTILLMSLAVNKTIYVDTELTSSQQQIAMIAEMIHTASLLHDDIIDKSNLRRGKATINYLWGANKAVLGGDYIISVAAGMLARIGNEDVITILSQVLVDLVQGEFMQLGSKEDEGERFTHYTGRIYRKTASLFANTCKAVVMLAGADANHQENAFEFGKNLGIAFQLIDDILDFKSSDFAMGKPTFADLKLGLATAPVLFACQKYPELNNMVMRRFSEPNDIEFAHKAVLESCSIQKSYKLAEQHAKLARSNLKFLDDSPEKFALENLSKLIIDRQK